MLSIAQIEPHVLRRKTLEYLVSQMLVILLAANISAIIMAVVLHEYVPTFIISTWLIALWAISGFRWIQARNYQRLDNPDIHAHYPQFFYSSAIAAVVWGAGIMFFLPYLPPIHQSFLLFMLVMMGTQACVKMPKDLFFVFLFGIGAPSAGWLLLSEDPLSFTLGMIYSMGILMLFVASYQFNQKLFQTITSGIQKQSLFEEMTTLSQALKL